VARRIRVPGLVDIVLVTEPVEIRALDDEPKVDRNFTPHGPLINRLITRRIRRWFHINDQRLPSLVPRSDAVRAEQQQKLFNALPPACGRPVCSDPQLERLALFVTGKASRDDAAITVQEIVGQAFSPDYTADKKSWKASALIDRFREGFSLREILWRVTGRLQRSRRLLIDRARQDRWTMHGTAIGMHGILQALDRMRALRAAPDAASLGEDAVLARCLAPPRQVPRMAEAMLATAVTPKRLRPGTLVMLRLREAGPRAPGPGTVFMHGHWNACPAQAFVTELVRAVWRRSAR
jgi:hypothetical protein